MYVHTRSPLPCAQVDHETAGGTRVETGRSQGETPNAMQVGVAEQLAEAVAKACAVVLQRPDASVSLAQKHFVLPTGQADALPTQ